jgi:hypothetical protein
MYLIVTAVDLILIDNPGIFSIICFTIVQLTISMWIMVLDYGDMTPIYVTAQ